MDDESNMKETELCLGLPGGAAANSSSMNKLPLAAGTKRVFSETHQESLDDHLKLNLLPPPPSSHLLSPPPTSTKPPPPKAQVVGWPPVRAHRKNAMKTQKNYTTPAASPTPVPEDQTSLGGAFVKVSIDGAPYLRKVDLNMYKSYRELSNALAKLFTSFTKGNDGEDGFIDFMNESKLKDALNSSDYAKTYQDKDGDWMLVGDVPWEMFVNSCKRLRIMKRSEAKGLAPTQVEKSK